MNVISASNFPLNPAPRPNFFIPAALLKFRALRARVFLARFHLHPPSSPSKRSMAAHRISINAVPVLLRLSMKARNMESAPSHRKTLTRFPAFRWWLIAVLSFWVATAFWVSVDFAGVTFLHITWPSGPRLFPNASLASPLAISQLLASLPLLAAGLTLARGRPGPRGTVSGACLVLTTGTLCYAAYLLLTLWYQIDFMRREI
jgi:hypothetical protein